MKNPKGQRPFSTLLGDLQKSNPLLRVTVVPRQASGHPTIRVSTSVRPLKRGLPYTFPLKDGGPRRPPKRPTRHELLYR
jgi:hypothetical protein